MSTIKLIQAKYKQAVYSSLFNDNLYQKYLSKLKLGNNLTKIYQLTLIKPAKGITPKYTSYLANKNADYLQVGSSSAFQLNLTLTSLASSRE